MRLSSIKLSGFKSFADPTHFQLPGQLVGVVGPNGCGKSNIMDAVRWVLGESRASELRGESMQDVIFNGSTSRKPASRASVELVFENADQRVAGHWGQYSEIAVRRVLTRDGTSGYFINNQAVRRRDVHDVFLGTGLGPRAYAIIGQGTISRIIESRPEELRLFLEEAAGVSKYKERRRESEHRVADARDNLSRVEDILRELGANLEKLEQQAAVASRYQALQNQVQTRQHQLWWLKRKESERVLQDIQAQGQQTVNALEAKMASLREAQSRLEHIRQEHYSASDAVSSAQGHLYSASSEVGRLEAQIRFVVEGRQRAQDRLGQIEAQLTQWQQRLEQTKTEKTELHAAKMEAEEESAILEAQMDEAAQTLPELEQAYQQALAQAQTQRDQVQAVQQQIQVLSTEQRHAQEQLNALTQRKERLAAQKNSQNEGLNPAQIQASEQQLAELRAECDTVQAQMLHLEASLAEAETQRKNQQNLVLLEQGKHTALLARLQALQTLQTKLEHEGSLAVWLEKQGLGQLTPLWKKLHIEKGWEAALEAALRERLHALEVGRLETVSAFVTQAPGVKLGFYSQQDAIQTSKPVQDAAAIDTAAIDTAAIDVAAPEAGLSHSNALVAEGAHQLPALIARLQLHDAKLKQLLSEWLHGCYTANSIEQAMAVRSKLAPGHTIYLAQGHAITRHGLDLYAEDSERAGMLARAQEMDSLNTQMSAQKVLLDEAKSVQMRHETDYQQTQTQLQQLRQEDQKLRNQAHSLEVEVLRQQQLAQQQQARQAQIEQDIGDTEAQRAQWDERLQQAQARFEELDMELADTQERHAELEEQAAAAKRQREQAQEQLRQLERQAREAEFTLRSLQAKEEELARFAASAGEQRAGLQEEQNRLQQELLSSSATEAETGLQSALAHKIELENKLAVARSHYDDLSAQLRSTDEQRLTIERELDPLRSEITAFQLKEQAARIAAEQYQEYLTEAGADAESLAQSIENEGVKLSGLQAEIDRQQREIQALGAVNLAALEELGTARERKEFLDAQSADLLDAITTLEGAIRKIDAETRQLLGATFDSVNEHFGRMFPSLFGGGQAKLVMTGEEILDAGVQVMAQPPGKKNQTIHLLSGGEKALTAIALVFAIFQLNPAPFCLLDEVDAPLDDANTERYAKLVTSMSGQTQFLFISHNKIAMEMAQQLIGVTMQEQGVSRIVAVDMETANHMLGG